MKESSECSLTWYVACVLCVAAVMYGAGIDRSQSGEE